MKSADKTFHLIAWKKGLVPKPRLDQALAECHRRGLSLESLLLQAGDIDSSGLERVLRTRARHAAQCPGCNWITYLMPGEAPGQLPCEHCHRPLVGSGVHPSGGYHTTGKHRRAPLVDEEDGISTVVEDSAFLQAHSLDAAAGTVLEPSAGDTLYHPPPDPSATILHNKVIQPPSAARAPDAMKLFAFGPPPGLVDMNATERFDSIVTETGGAANLVLVARMEPYRFDPAKGTIDATLSPAFQDGRFQFADIVLEAGAGVVAAPSAPLILMASGQVRISGTIDLCGKDAELPGGGGTGGGAMRITATQNLSIDGTVLADGGRGLPGMAGAGHGGGGSGGSILLQSMQRITVDGIISAMGGPGGDDSETSGAAGGDGRIHLEDGDGKVQVPGSISPSPTTGSML